MEPSYVGGVSDAAAHADLAHAHGERINAWTLAALQAEYPQAQLYLVMGEDQARALASWHRAEELGRTAIICVASRSGPQACAVPSVGAYALPGLPLQPLHLPPSPLNATEIRDRTAQGQSVSALVFESVARYIDQHHLYQAR